MKNRIARFFRLLRADAIEGFASIVRLLFISCALFVLLIGLLFLKADASGADYSKATFADFVLLIAGGSKTDIYDPSSNMPFVLPAEWMLSMLLMLFTSLRFPYRNLMGIGKTLMVEGERWSWWLSKCVWTVSCDSDLLGPHATCFSGYLSHHVWVARPDAVGGAPVVLWHRFA